MTTRPHDDDDHPAERQDGSDRYDGPWKEAIQHYTEAFMALFSCAPQGYSGHPRRPRLERPARVSGPGAAKPHTVVLAHLKTQATRHDPPQRARWMEWIIERLYERGLGKDDILTLYRFVDWMMALPRELEQQVVRSVARVEKERGMPYITSAERLGKQEGKQEGMKEGMKEGSLGQARQDVLQALEVRFGAVPPPVREAVLAVSDLDLLGELHRLAILVESVAAFEGELAGPTEE